MARWPQWTPIHTGRRQLEPGRDYVLSSEVGGRQGRVPHCDCCHQDSWGGAVPCFMRGAGRGEAARGFGAVGRRAPVRSAGRSRLRVSSNIRARWPPLSEARACLHLRPRVSPSVPRFQRADLRRVQVPAPGHAGGAHQRHAAPRDPGDDQQVHD